MLLSKLPIFLFYFMKSLFKRDFQLATCSIKCMNSLLIGKKQFLIEYKLSYFMEYEELITCCCNILVTVSLRRFKHNKLDS